MHPLLQLPFTDISLPAHAFMVGLGAAVAIVLGYRWAIRSEGLPTGRVCWAAVVITFATFVGGRLHFVAANWGQIQDYAQFWRVSFGALHAPGAVIGALCGALIVLPPLSLPFGRFVDGVAPAIGIGIAVARVGCFLHGCCFGHATNYPWGVTLPSDSYVFTRQLEEHVLPPDANRSLPVHPLPLYFAAVGLGMTAFLVYVRPRKRYDGQLALWAFVVLSVSCTVLETFRADDPLRVFIGPLPQLLWVSLAMALASITALVTVERRQRGDSRARIEINRLAESGRAR